MADRLRRNHPVSGRRGGSRLGVVLAATALGIALPACSQAYPVVANSAPDSTAAINAALAKAIASGGREVDLMPNETYGLTATRGVASDGSAVALILKGANDFTFNCRGSTLSLLGADKSKYGMVIRIEGGERVTLKHCFFDYQAMPYTQATLVSVGADTATFQIDPAYPVAWPSIQRVSQYDPNSKLWMQQVLEGPRNRPVKMISGNQVEVDFKNTDTAALAKLRAAGPGTSYILQNEVYGPGDRSPQTVNAVSFIGTKGLTFDHDVVYSNAGEAFQGQDVENVLFSNSGCEIKPGATRVQSTNADCINIEGDRGTFEFTHGVIEGSQDDGINVYAQQAPIAAVVSSTQVTVGAAEGTWRPGDTVEFIDARGQQQGAAVIATATLKGGATELTTKGPIPGAITSGACTPASRCLVSDQSAAPALMTVAYAHIGRLRGHAIMGNAEKIVIAHDAFYELPSNGALLFDSNFKYFHQGPMPRHGVIENNTFENVNSVGFDPGAISIYNWNSAGTAIAPAGSVGDWSILNNELKGTRRAFVYAAGFDGLRASGNSCSDWALNDDALGGFPYYHVGHACFALINVTHGLISTTNRYAPPAGRDSEPVMRVETP